MASAGQREFLLPLFPLPNLVFFPQTRLPLHVFEPRYRQLIADVVAADRRFGIVLLKAGWEADYFGAPPVHLCGTMGRIEQTVALEDGRYNILINGEARFRIIDEVTRDPYRIVRVVTEPQIERDATSAWAQRTWLTDLSQQYMHYLPEQGAVPEIQTAGLESLTNALVMSLNLEIDQKQELLEIDDIVERAEIVGIELQTRIESMQFLAPFRRGGGDPNRN